MYNNKKEENDLKNMSERSREKSWKEHKFRDERNIKIRKIHKRMEN